MVCLTMFFFFQTDFAITAPVINFSGNFLHLLVSLSRDFFSLPPLVSRRFFFKAMKSSAALPEFKKGLLVLFKGANVRGVPQIVFLHCRVDLQLTLPHCRRNSLFPNSRLGYCK